MMIELPGRKVSVENAVAEAVYLVFGGVTEASRALGVTTQAIYKVLAVGHVETRGKAEEWASAAAKRGGKPIPATELIGLVPWSGPDRHPHLNGNGASRPKGRRRSAPAQNRTGTSICDERAGEQPAARILRKAA